MLFLRITNRGTSKKMTTEINGLAELESFMSDNEEVIIEFYAEWYVSSIHKPQEAFTNFGRCQPCKVITPYFNSLASEFPDVKFGSVDVDQHVEICKKFEVDSMPTFMYFKNGETKKSVIGASKSKLLEMLNSVTE